MCEENPISFQEYYAHFYTEKHALLSTPQEARAVLSAFIEYRKLLNLPSRSAATRQGVTLIYKMLYHKRLMESAMRIGDASCTDLHWKATLEAWKLFLYAIYMDDASHPDQTAGIGLRQRAKLWWRRTQVSREVPTALPRRAWAMVYAVDALHDQLLVTTGAASGIDRQSL